MVIKSLYLSVNPACRQPLDPSVTLAPLSFSLHLGPTPFISPSNTFPIQTEKRDPANQPLERCNECHCYRPTRSRSHTLSRPSSRVSSTPSLLCAPPRQLFIFFSLAFHRIFPNPPPPPCFPLDSLLFLLFLSFVSSRCWFRWLLKLWKRLDASALARLNGDESTIRGDASSGMPPVFYDSQVPYKFT